MKARSGIAPEKCVVFGQVLMLDKRTTGLVSESLSEPLSLSLIESPLKEIGVCLKLRMLHDALVLQVGDASILKLNHLAIRGETPVPKTGKTELVSNSRV
jgi:hypothetical protein